MSLQRIASAMVCLVVGIASAPLGAQTLHAQAADLALTPVFVPDYTAEAAAAAVLPAVQVTSVARALRSLSPAELDETITEAVTSQVIFRAPRKRVADFAMRLRDVRYVRGGRDPSTGFDCSGFTHYVYNQTYGLDLPYDAPSQFRNGKDIPRDQMRTGDLVFFQVGKRITHVGIYLDDGHFIHSPSPGKRVRVDSLSSAYWAKRFAGAKRPTVS